MSSESNQSASEPAPHHPSPHASGLDGASLIVTNNRINVLSPSGSSGGSISSYGESFPASQVLTDSRKANFTINDDFSDHESATKGTEMEHEHEESARSEYDETDGSGIVPLITKELETLALPGKNFSGSSFMSSRTGSVASMEGMHVIDDSYKPKFFKIDNSLGQMEKVKKTQVAKLADLGKSVKIRRHERDVESRVMVLYTGGTIGMRLKDDVYIPEANFLPPAIRKIPHLNDLEYTRAHYSSVEYPPNVLPVVKGEDRRILYWLFEYEPLLDSCNITYDDWIRVALDIKANYENYDGFVVLHGTDTLCYTASALSFMLENLGKPVIVTGAQIPICEVRSDGRENFIGALIVAGNHCIPEVLVYFNNKIMRGNRCSKTDSAGLDAFNAPNIPPLGTLGVNILIHWDAIFRSVVPMKLHVHTNFNRNVGVLRIFPSITIGIVRAFLQPPIEGVVLQTYGAGNIPTNRKDIFEALKEAVDRGVLIVNISQCSKGNVCTLYATGQIMTNAGVIPGADMTNEAALTKLAYVLGKQGWTLEKRKKMLTKNLRGELTCATTHTASLISTSTNLGDVEFLQCMETFIKTTNSEEMFLVKAALFPPLLCHAAASANLELLEALKTQLNANLCAADYDNRTALHIAASCGHANVVRYLLRNGCSVHARDRWGDTALGCAVKHCNFECIEMLVTAGAHLNLRPSNLGMELCLAAEQGDITKLRAWKMAGADLNTPDYDGRRALHIAAAVGHLSTTEMLLQEGADSDLTDVFGRVALDEAVKNGHTPIVNILDNL